MKKLLNKIQIDLKVVQLSFFDSIKAIFTDGGAILILIFAAVIYPVVYSIAYNNQVVSDIPTAVIDNDNTALSRKLSKMLDATPALNVYTKANDMVEAEKLFWDNEVFAVVLIPEGFEKDVLKGKQTTVSLYADASNFLLYKESYKSTMATAATFAAGVEYKRFLTKLNRPELAVSQISPIQTNTYNLFNPSGSYGHFVMPGLMLLIIQQTLLVGIGLVGGVGRERKRDTFKVFGCNIENHVFAVITGKSLAYFIVGMFNFLFGTILVYNWFSFPDKGAFINVIILAVPYLLSVVFLGMTISLMFKHREHAIIALVFLSPIVLFASGLSWPEESIPKVLRIIFNIFPSNFAIPAFIRLRTMGVEIIYIKKEMMYLIMQMVAYYLIAGFSFKWALMHKRKVKK